MVISALSRFPYLKFPYLESPLYNISLGQGLEFQPQSEFRNFSFNLCRLIKKSQARSLGRILVDKISDKAKLMSYLYKEFLVPQITRKRTYQVLLIADSLTWRLVLKVSFHGNDNNFQNNSQNWKLMRFLRGSFSRHFSIQNKI